MKTSNLKKWLNVIEFLIVSFLSWLDPSAGLLIFLVNLYFHILKALLDEPDKK